MPTEFEDDALNDLMDVDALGIAAVYQPGTAQEKTFYIIFDDSFSLVSAESGEIESTAPEATAKSSDVSGVEHGDELKINGTLYSIAGIQPDGTGLTTLILHKEE